MDMGFEIINKLLYKHMELNNAQLDLITGSLLGDGSLSKQYGSANVLFCKTQCVEHRDYLLWHSDVLRGFSKIIKVFSKKIKSENGRILRMKEKIPQFRIYTKSDSVFTQLEKKWYLRNKNDEYIYNKLGHRIKLIPNDLVLNPLVLAVWHCDDGCNIPENRTVSFSTQSFDRHEVEFLVNLLYKNLNLKSYVCCSGQRYLLNMSSGSYLDFIGMIKPYITWDCMYKKIDLEKYVEPCHAKGEKHGMAKLNDDLIRKTFDLHAGGYNQIQISNMLNVDNTTIQYVLKGKTWKHLGLKPIKTRTNNKSGCVGVYQRKESGKWVAEIIRNKSYISLGVFDNKKEAIIARKNAERLYYNV